MKYVGIVLDVLEECRGQSEPCHEFKLCMKEVEKMQNKFEDRLLNANDVIEAVDNHTREDGTLDDDISVILEEVEAAFDKESVIDELKKQSSNYYPSIDHYCLSRKAVNLKDALRIVEKGGI